MTIDTLKQAAQALRVTKPELAAALEAMAEQKPVAWRYTTARGNYRYRGPSETFAQEYKILKPFPLYAAPIATPEHDAKASATPKAGEHWLVKMPHASALSEHEVVELGVLAIRLQELRMRSWPTPTWYACGVLAAG